MRKVEIRAHFSTELQPDGREFGEGIDGHTIIGTIASADAIGSKARGINTSGWTGLLNSPFAERCFTV